MYNMDCKLFHIWSYDGLERHCLLCKKYQINIRELYLDTNNKYTLTDNWVGSDQYVYGGIHNYPDSQNEKCYIIRDKHGNILFCQLDVNTDQRDFYRSKSYYIGEYPLLKT